METSGLQRDRREKKYHIDIKQEILLKTNESLTSNKILSTARIRISIDYYYPISGQL